MERGRTHPFPHGLLDHHRGWELGPISALLPVGNVWLLPSLAESSVELK